MAGRSSRLVVAKEACVVTVGARPIEYHTADVLNERTGLIHKDLPLTEIEPKDPGDDGIAYAFRQFQKVQRDHPAVKAAPGAFMPLSELSEVDLELANG